MYKNNEENIVDSPQKGGASGGSNQEDPQYYYQGLAGNYLTTLMLAHAIDNKLYVTSYDDYWHMESILNMGSLNNN